MYPNRVDLVSEPSRRRCIDSLARCARDAGIAADPAAWEQMILEQLRDDEENTASADPEASSNNDNFENVLSEIGLSVLGENENQSIELWSEATERKYTVKTPAKLELEDILQMIGSERAQNLWRHATEPPPGKICRGEVRRAVAGKRATALCGMGSGESSRRRIDLRQRSEIHASRSVVG